MVLALGTWAARSAAATVPGVIGRLPTKTRTVFLTFDDGPSNSTSEVLDLLQDAQSSATFFLLGNQLERYPAAASLITDAGHGIGNHSFRHLDAWTHRWADVETDLNRGSRLIREMTGATPQWMRPPYGRFRRNTLLWCRENGQRLALWDVMGADFLRGVPIGKAAAQVVRNVRPGSIVVLHDGDRHQPHALDVTREVLSRLVESGWSFERLPETPPSTQS